MPHLLSPVRKSPTVANHHKTGERRSRPRNPDICRAGTVTVDNPLPMWPRRASEFLENIRHGPDNDGRGLNESRLITQNHSRPRLLLRILGSERFTRATRCLTCMSSQTFATA